MDSEAQPVRTRMRAAERKRSILDAAEQTFARLGYRVATMSDVAEAAGITQPMVYRHFRSKRELFLAVLDRAVDQIKEMWRQAPDLEHMGAAYAQLAMARPDLVHLRLQALTEGNDAEIRDRFQSLFLGQVEMVRAKVTQGIAAGGRDPAVDAEGMVWLFTALGMLVDTCVALNLDGTPRAIEAAAGYFWQRADCRPGGRAVE